MSTQRQSARRPARPHGRTILLSALIGILVLGAGVGPAGIGRTVALSSSALSGARAHLGSLPGWLRGRFQPPGRPGQPGAMAPGGWAGATADLTAIATRSGGRVSISWRELDGPSPRSLDLAADQAIFAGSTYKLPLLVAEAQEVSTGRASGTDTICFQEDDYEAGWFDDYTGSCFDREQLAERTGLFSDNTAGHMLTRELGGPDALNAAARSQGARNSVFFTDNTTTTGDLAAILTGVATKRSLDAAGLAWLKPKLTNTQAEMGVPAGVSAPAQVVHKTGEFGTVTNDAALVLGGHGGAYVLVVCTDGAAGGGDAAWSVIRALSARVWAYEQTR